MGTLNEALDREIAISARRETVFRFFTDSERFARWWGEGSRIDARPGGAVSIRYPNGIAVTGEVVEIEPPQRIVFTYGYTGTVPADFSRVTITLDETGSGTLVKLHHAFSSAKIRDQHVQGWRYQLALFSRSVSEEQHADAAARIDDYLLAFGHADAETRRRLLSASADPALVFRDAFGATSGVDDLLANLEAVQAHMPGVRLRREGEVRLSHGTALAGWVAEKEDGTRVGSGTNVYDLAPDGRIARVVGFWQ
jgi:uncharacterized protein YndB with AHSA1/START domain